MESERKQIPLIVILGPTASGKSALAMDVAQKFNGEIICADSRTVYRGMDIGTAKPSPEDQREVPHHLLDIINPDQSFTAAEFKRQALLKLDEIAGREKLAMLAGGTGLYIDGIIFDFAFLPPVPTEDRDSLQSLSVEQLQQKVIQLGLKLPENSRNPRHLIRTIETNGAVAVKNGLRKNTLVLGLDISREELRSRIQQRIEGMLAAGLEQEVQGLLQDYDWRSPGMSAVGYREWHGYFDGQETSQEVLAAITNNSLQYAKRQRTWFKRNPYIRWVQNAAEAERIVKEFLQK